MNIAILALAAAVTVNFDSDIGRMRPELHSSGFGPTDYILERIPIRMIGNRLVLKKTDSNSAAFSVLF